MHNVVKDLCLGCSRSRKDRGAKTSLTALLGTVFHCKVDILVLSCEIQINMFYFDFLLV